MAALDCRGASPTSWSAYDKRPGMLKLCPSPASTYSRTPRLPEILHAPPSLIPRLPALLPFPFAHGQAVAYLAALCGVSTAGIMLWNW